MRQYSIDFEFFDAIEGSLLPDEFIEKSRRKSNEWYQKDEGEGKSMRLAEIGVAVSHYKIYQKILTEKIDFAIVMEDDASFDERFSFFLTQLKHIKRVLKKYNLILLGYCSHDLNYNAPGLCSYWGRMRIGSKFKVGIPLKWYWSAIGYIISYEGADLLSEKQGLHPSVTADILTANSPIYGVKLGVITKPIIWPGELSNISTIQLHSKELTTPKVLPEIGSEERNLFNVIKKLTERIKNFLRKEKMKWTRKQYLFTTDKY